MVIETKDPTLKNFHNVGVLAKIIQHPNCDTNIINMIVHNHYVSVRMLGVKSNKIMTGGAYVDKNFHELVNAVVTNPYTDIETLQMLTFYENVFNVLDKLLVHPNATGDYFINYGLLSHHLDKRHIAEQFMVKRDGFQDWPLEWLEDYYGRKFVTPHQLISGGQYRY